MALTAEIKGSTFGVGDTVKVYQKVKEGEKTRLQVFEGIVIAIKGRGSTKTFTVRRIGEAQIGIERIFPLNSPNVERVQVVKSGLAGVRHSKLYFIRDKSKREVDKIFKRAARKKK
jgi:large subunit ribosomal protein L19